MVKHLREARFPPLCSCDLLGKKPTNKTEHARNEQPSSMKQISKTLWGGTGTRRSSCVLSSSAWQPHANSEFFEELQSIMNASSTREATQPLAPQVKRETEWTCFIDSHLGKVSDRLRLQDMLQVSLQSKRLPEAASQPAAKARPCVSIYQPQKSC
eukprot:3778750-Amphidinium_carterae.1